WGIKVPSNNEHIIYVWLDALTNYLSALNFPDDKDKKYIDFWPASVHLIGKDILRFHAVYWPAFLLAAGIKPPKRIFSHGWILSGEEKMSKSKGNILDPLEIIKIYGLDPLRYYLLKEVSFGNDGSISKEKLINCINSDLANNYGNLCQRVLSFMERNLNLTIPSEIKFENSDLDVLNIYKENYDTLINEIDSQNLNKYVNFIQNQLFNANKYFNDQEPWKKKDNLLRLGTIMYTSLELIRRISILLYPIIPNTALKVLKIFNISENNIHFNSIYSNEFLKKNDKINTIPILFKKVEND
ncbi:MAG: methionine--tRNA ligase, partial [Candidatus Pelagibacter sp.]